MAGGAGAAAARSAETTADRGSDDSPQTPASGAPDAAWTRTYAAEAELASVDAIIPQSNGYVLAGTAGERDYRGLVVRTDAAGRPRRQRTLGAAASGFAAGAAHPDGGVVLAGTTNVRERGPTAERPLSADPWLVRLDGAGEPVWTRTLQPTAAAGGIETLARVADGYLVAGRRRRDREAGARPWVARVSLAGHRRWARTLGGSDRKGWLNAVDVADDAWYVGGSTTPADDDETDGADGSGSDAGEDESALVVRLDPDGTTRWQYTADVRKGSRIEALHADEGGAVALGNRRFAVDDDGRGWHLRLAADGTVDWQRSHSTGPWNWLHGMTALDDGYLLVGTRERATDERNGPRGAWVLRTGPTGRPRWETTYFDGEYSDGQAVRAIDGGAFLVAGGTDTDAGEAGWLLNAGGADSPGGSGGAGPLGAASEPLAAVGERVPPDADAYGVGALVGAGAVAAGRRLLGDS